MFVSVSLVQREIELDPDNDEYPAIQIKVSRLVDVVGTLPRLCEIPLTL